MKSLVRYLVKIESRDPIFIGSSPEVGFETRGLPYIPGSALRGALAGAWIRQHGKFPKDFDKESEELSGFISTFEGATRFGPCHAEGSRIRGLSELHLKYHREATGELPVIVDLAFDPRPGTGEYEAGKGQIDGVRMVYRTQTAIDETTGSARESHLYRFSAIAKGTILLGHIFGESTWLDGLCDREFTMWIGGKRTSTGRARPPGRKTRLRSSRAIST